MTKVVPAKKLKHSFRRSVSGNLLSVSDEGAHLQRSGHTVCDVQQFPKTNFCLIWEKMIESVAERRPLVLTSIFLPTRQTGDITAETVEKELGSECATQNGSVE